MSTKLLFALLLISMTVNATLMHQKYNSTHEFTRSGMPETSVIIEDVTPVVEKVKPQHETQITTDWDKLILSIIHVSSNGDEYFTSKDREAVGLLAITPIYVKEVNRLCGHQQYTLQDRFSAKKSLEMFAILQSHHNKQRNVDKAIRLHNKTNSYKAKVKQLMSKPDILSTYKQWLN